MNNLLSYCGLVDGKIRASDKDLPVTGQFKTNFYVPHLSLTQAWSIFDVATVQM